MLHHGMVLVFQQEAGNQQHEDKRGQGDGEGGRGRPEDAHPMRATSIDDGRVAYVGGGVDADRPGRHLRHGHDIGELTHRHPVMVSDDFTLYHR